MITAKVNSQNSLLSQGGVAKKPFELHKEACIGVVGRFVQLIGPQTESDEVALLVQLLSAFSNIIGRTPHFMVEDNRHPLTINPVCVGETSKARKGTAWSRVKNVLRLVEPKWAENNITSGLSTAEGLIWAVRDPIPSLNDLGIVDKRLLVIEQEFASVLKRSSKQDSTLSPVIRDAFDGNILRSLTKTSPGMATNSHIGIIGHITKEELIRYLDSTEIANGFANRFLWVCVCRSKCLPRGGKVEQMGYEALAIDVKAAIEFSGNIGEMTFDAEADELWISVYPRLSEGRPGIVGSLTARAEAYVMRLACLYALLGQAHKVNIDHLKAALALWDYSERSVGYVFGEKFGDPIADTLYSALISAPDGLSRTAMFDLFGRHVKAAQIEFALHKIKSRYGLEQSKRQTGGRSEEFYNLPAKEVKDAS